MRRTYKLLSWDHELRRGYATDNTYFDGEPFQFTIYENDLELEHEGRLLPEEIFSAQESPNHQLFDIIIEEGPRSIKEQSRRLMVQQAETAALEPPFDPNGNGEKTNWSAPSLESRVFKLEKEMAYLINRYGDDGK